MFTHFDSRATKSRTKPTGFKDSCKSTSNDDDLSRNDQLFMLSLWSALVLIQNSLPNCPQVSDDCEIFSFGVAPLMYMFLCRLS